MSRFEHIINLMHPNGSGGSTLDQHCSAMRMDNNHSWTYNKLSYAITDAKADCQRLAKADPVADLDGLITEARRDREYRDSYVPYDWYGYDAYEWERY